MRPQIPAGPFASLTPQPPDPLLSIIKAHRDDPRPGKIDLGVGVYRDETGRTPVFEAVKAAESRLLEHQDSKAYLGPEGDVGFLERLRPVVFGDGCAAADLMAVQTPGGTGALRLAAALAKAGRPEARVWLGTPSWPIHAQIFAAAGLQVETYRYFDLRRQRVDFDAMTAALDRASPSDLFLLHGCCHNPTGAELSPDEWDTVADLVVGRGLIPLVDLAYQGLGSGLEPDAAGLRRVFAVADEALCAYSLDKNFGLYRERAGALFVRSRSRPDAVRSNLLALGRCLWSMPPDHGAAVARLILEDAQLTCSWRAELAAMRARLNGVRQALAEAEPGLAFMRGQRGLFSVLPLSPAEIETLRRDAAVYMAGSGRINIAGLTPLNLPTFIMGFRACASAADA